jgi:molybdate transport system substrate-binding protein
VRRFVLLMVSALAVAALGCHVSVRAAEPGKLRVAAAADLKFALDEVVELFRQRHPDISVQVTYGSSGNFYAQLSNRAPFDTALLKAPAIRVISPE